ncbi:glycine cleavage system protein R [Kribbia dieselivorans]|uniref:glycine cleavage system protein R n=1 Tax=Kribbia dieselivorans TaxID=331526 RepID=UPI000838A82A|nr:ACT domain-containing protein [Kribbia dieselivorans]
MATLVLTAIGDERPGLVAELSAVVTAHEGNWLESHMARLAGKFAGVVLVDVPDLRVPALTEALTGLGATGLTVTTAMSEEPAEAEGHLVAVHLVGQDRPGIVREITAALAELGATIDEILTFTQPAPMGDGMLFEADAAVLLPPGVAWTEAQTKLESIAAELMVDLDIADDDGIGAG